MRTDSNNSDKITRVPLWIVLLLLLASVVAVPVFGDLVMRGTQYGKDTVGFAGRGAMFVSRLPGKVRHVFDTIWTDSVDGNSELRVARSSLALDGFTPLATDDGTPLRGLLGRRNQPLDGWRLVAGAFDLGNGPINAAIALRPDLSIARTWVLDEPSSDEYFVNPPHRKFIHGIDLLEDGSMILTFDSGRSIQRMGACGARRWITYGMFHHSVTADEASGTAWTLHNHSAGTEELAHISLADGEVLKRISFNAIADANPEIDILHIRTRDADDVDGNTRYDTVSWLYDPLHTNDVDPLPVHLANAFPMFKAGDLLVSARSVNLVFVVNPETLRIKWWRIGATRRQHDPDWQADGTISIYDNRMDRAYSSLISIHPENYTVSTLLDGELYDFYSRIRGKHTITTNGHTIVTSPQQARGFEVDAEGKLVFELVNIDPDDVSSSYVISEILPIPDNIAARLEAPCNS